MRKDLKEKNQKSSEEEMREETPEERQKRIQGMDIRVDELPKTEKQPGDDW